MRKTKITSKLMALLLTLTLSMALATSVYAAENDNNKTTETAETTSAVQPRGMVVAGGSTNLSNGTGTIYLDLGQVFRHIFPRIYIFFSSFAWVVDVNIKENL